MFGFLRRSNNTELYDEDRKELIFMSASVNTPGAFVILLVLPTGRIAHLVFSTAEERDNLLAWIDDQPGVRVIATQPEAGTGDAFIAQ